MTLDVEEKQEKKWRLVAAVWRSVFDHVEEGGEELYWFHGGEMRIITAADNFTVAVAQANKITSQWTCH